MLQELLATRDQQLWFTRRGSTALSTPSAPQPLLQQTLGGYCRCTHYCWRRHTLVDCTLERHPSYTFNHRPITKYIASLVFSISLTDSLLFYASPPTTMYHTSGLPTLATRGSRAIPAPATDLDPRVHTFSSFLFSHNEKKLEKRVRHLTSRLKKKDAEIAELRALLDQSAPAPSLAESVDENAYPHHSKGVADQLIAELKAKQAERRAALSDLTNHQRLPSLNDEVTHHITPRTSLVAPAQLVILGSAVLCW